MCYPTNDLPVPNWPPYDGNFPIPAEFAAPAASCPRTRSIQVRQRRGEVSENSTQCRQGWSQDGSERMTLNGDVEARINY
jgi:hypothetical protein